MTDLNLEWGADLTQTPAGDLSLVDGPAETRQHIIRRLLSAVNGYIWHQGYGLGLPQRVGRVARTSVIRALVRAQIYREATVARLPLPVVTVDYIDTTPGLYVIAIRYTDAITGVAQKIQLEVPGSR